MNIDIFFQFDIKHAAVHQNDRLTAPSTERSRGTIRHII